MVVFDASGTSFRNDMYADYKANRDAPPPELKPQFSLVREAARAFSLPAVEEEGYEADDLIASYARTARAAGEEVLVVSSDKDLMQLVGDGVRMWDPMKQKEIGRDEVVERFGVGPELVRDALALIGDTSDNVPGVPGIGPKTAAQLLQEHGSLEGLLAHADAIKQPKRREALIANAEQARLAYQLVGLNASAPLPVPLDGVRRQALDPQRILAFCQENGFRSLAARIEQVAEAAQTQRDERAATTERRWVTVTDLAALDAILARAVELGRLSFDTETTSLDVARARLVGVSLARRAGRGLLPAARPRRRVRAAAPGPAPDGRCGRAAAAGAGRPRGAEDRAQRQVRPRDRAQARARALARRRHDADLLRARRRQPRPRHGRAGAAELGLRDDPLRERVRQGGRPDLLRPGADRQGDRLRRRGRGGDAAALAGAQAPPPRGADAHRLRDAGAPARPGDRRHGGLRHPGRRGAAAPALGRVRPAHGPARGGGLPAGRPPLQHRLAEAAGRGAVRPHGPGRVRPRSGRGGAQDQDRRLRDRGRRARGAGGAGARAAARHPRLAAAPEADADLHRRAARPGRPGDAPGPHLASP